VYQELKPAYRLVPAEKITTVDVGTRARRNIPQEILPNSEASTNAARLSRRTAHTAGKRGKRLPNSAYDSKRVGGAESGQRQTGLEQQRPCGGWFGSSGAEWERARSCRCHKEDY
jgi:hypothetical protein